MRRRAVAGLAAAGMLGAAAPAALTAASNRRARPGRPRLLAPAVRLDASYRTVPDRYGRTLLVDRSDGTVAAVLTTGARTVLLTGPSRTFSERATTDATVTGRWWVRVAPTPWQAGAHTHPAWARWLAAAVGDSSPDVLHTASRYLHGTPRTGTGGDAGFGLEGRDGADFYDCLGIGWRFPDVGWRRPDPRWRWRLDCSGFVRLVYGWGHGITMYGGTRTAGLPAGLPRTAAAIAAHAPAVTVAASQHPDRPPADLHGVQPGDLVFFALHDPTPHRITHSGICVGRDRQGRMRFVSSRRGADGPTMGDVGGTAVIDEGHFGTRLRRAIRL